MKVYNKLVRDKITDIIEADGRKAKYRILDNNEYKEELNKKLQEEVKEYLEDKNVEELADIIEVIYGILNSMEVSIEEFENKLWTVYNYLFEDDKNILELSFWTDGSEKEIRDVDIILSTLKKND